MMRRLAMPPPRRLKRREQILRGALASFILFLLVFAGSCLPKSPSDTASSRSITVYGFSVMKESLEKAIFPGFIAKWKQEYNQDVRFTSSFAGSETITNQIIAGVGADIVILSIERDVDRLREGGFVTSVFVVFPI